VTSGGEEYSQRAGSFIKKKGNPNKKEQREKSAKRHCHTLKFGHQRAKTGGAFWMQTKKKLGGVKINEEEDKWVGATSIRFYGWVTTNLPLRGG